MGDLKDYVALKQKFGVKSLTDLNPKNDKKRAQFYDGLIELANLCEVDMGFEWNLWAEQIQAFSIPEEIEVSRKELEENFKKIRTSALISKSYSKLAMGTLHAMNVLGFEFVDRIVGGEQAEVIQKIQETLAIVDQIRFDQMVFDADLKTAYLDFQYQLATMDEALNEGVVKGCVVDACGFDRVGFEEEVEGIISGSQNITTGLKKLKSDFSSVVQGGANASTGAPVHGKL